MTIKIITLIASGIAVIQALSNINKGNLKRGIADGFITLTMATLMRIYF